MADLPFLANSNGPAWLPGAAKDARQFAFWGQLILVAMFIIAVILAIVAFVFSNWASGVYFIISAAVDVVLLFLMNSTVFEPLDQGKFREASDRLLIWGILALVFSLVVPGIFLLLAFIRLQEVFQPQYQQYPTQYYQGPQQYPQQAPPPAPPQQYQQPQYQAPPPQPAPQYQPAPAPQPVAPAPEAQQHRSEMTKCKNCGVQYPSFMRNCPNCGAPR